MQSCPANGWAGGNRLGSTTFQNLQLQPTSFLDGPKKPLQVNEDKHPMLSEVTGSLSSLLCYILNIPIIQ